MRLGICQESLDRFAFTIHADREPVHAYAEFAAGDLRASWAKKDDGGMEQRLVAVSAPVEEARRMFLDRVHNDPGASVEGAVMALDTASDSWLYTRLRNDMPGYHVALAFAFVPMVGSFRDDGLIHIPFEMMADKRKSVSWRILHHAILRQTAAIVCPQAPTGADACAFLANRTDIVDYLGGLGDTFSCADIEELARRGQTSPSTVIAMANGPDGKDCSWLYRVALSQRSIANKDLLGVTYARAKARHASGLRNRPIWRPLTAEQLAFHEEQINRFAHHLAIL
jgi:hypothetical protein